MKQGYFYRIAAVTFIGLVLFFTFTETKDKPSEQLKIKNLEVRVFFGYKDARPARFVADRYEMAIFLQKLTGPCVADRQDCEFGRVEKSDQVQAFSKMITQSDGSSLKVNLQVFSSSVGADDNENRKNPYQKWKSEYLKDQFTKALKIADIVFYNGHSRAGGGPDFTVPELTKSKHVNYIRYQEKKLGLNLIQTALKQSPNSPLQVVGMYSCQSDQLFRKKIEDAKPSLKVIGSRQLLYFTDAFNDSLDQLSQILKLHLTI